MIIAPLPGSSSLRLTISRTNSASGRNGRIARSPGSPSYHQNLSGGNPSRAGNSKRMREVFGNVSAYTRESSSHSTTFG
jgi:hypothetical protein